MLEINVLLPGVSAYCFSTLSRLHRYRPTNSSQTESFHWIS